MSVARVDVEAGPQRPLLGEALDDGALVVVEVRLDAAPERRRCRGRAGRRCGSPPSAAAARSLTTRELRAFRRSRRSGSGSASTSRYQSRSWTGDVVVVAAQEQVPQRAQHTALGLEGHVDGLQRDACLGCDRRHRGRGVALLLEQPLGGVEDLPTRRGGLLAPVRRLVATGVLDRLGHFGSLSMNSLLITGNEMTGKAETMRSSDTDRDPRGPCPAAPHVGGRGTGVGGERGVRRRPRRARRQRGCSTSRSRSRASACSSSHAGPAGRAWRRRRWSRPGGEVVLSDVADSMTAIAAARATALGLRNVTTRVLDLEHIDEPDAGYDVVLCREGLMLVARPGRGGQRDRSCPAAGRPGRGHGVGATGRETPGSASSSTSSATSSARRCRRPGSRTRSRSPTPGELAGLFSAAGLVRRRRGRACDAVPAASVDEWWERTAALAGPLAQRLAALPPTAAQALRRRAGDAIGVYRTPAGLDIPGVSLVASARRRQTERGG